MEEYRDIKNYPNHEVSNTGKVKDKRTGKLLSIKLTKDGYSTVFIKESNKYPRLRVHKLVMDAFSNNTGKEINHIDGNKQNNNLDNLEYTTHKDNMVHAVENGLINNNRRITVKDHLADLTYSIRSITELSKLTGVNKVTLIPLIKGSVDDPIKDRYTVVNPPNDINNIVNNGGKPNIPINITDNRTNVTKTYNSITAASYETSIPIPSISASVKFNRLYRSRYIISKT